MRSDVSVLATQIACLAGLGLRSITARLLTTLVRVEVSAGASAVAIGGNCLLMDVVHFKQSVQGSLHTYSSREWLGYSLKGPPSLGSPEIATEINTPLPSVPETAVTEP